MSWREDAFFPAFNRAGMLKSADVLYHDTDVVLEDVHVAFSRPDIDPMTGVQSSDYLIEYEFAVLPDLDEGDHVVIDDVLYQVREVPFADGAGATGFFRKAKLTKASQP